MIAFAASNQKSPWRRHRKFIEDAGKLRCVERLADHAGRGEEHLALAAADGLGGGRGRQLPWTSRPLRPVKALALPELTTTARALPPRRFALQKSTGADGHFDVVKTPATAAGRIEHHQQHIGAVLVLDARQRRWPCARRAAAACSAKDLGASGETEPDMAFPVDDDGGPPARRAAGMITASVRPRLRLLRPPGAC